VIPILYQDDDIVAINKPEGLATIPEGAEGRESLLSSLQPTFPEKLFVVHRLDKEASGVVLFAKNAAAHRYLNDQFSNRQVSKCYLALVHGIIGESEGRVDKPLRQFGSGRMGIDPESGKASVTTFEVMERFTSHTLLRVYLLTGRRHQIRVHLYSIGHPIVGDLRYGDRTMQSRFLRLMLHAAAISLRLPSGEEVTIEASVPESFQKGIEAVRGVR